MRIMGIDYGDSRIGVAISDPFGWTAQGVETINNQGKSVKAIERIIKLIVDYGVEDIVVGFPKNMNGTVGPRGEKTIEFISHLDSKISKELNKKIEIIKWDERLTTIAASKTMHEIGTKTSKKKGLVDQIAASFILQGYLDNINK